MAYSLPEQFLTAAELATRTEEILAQLHGSSEAIGITAKGKPVAVLLDTSQYEYLLHLLNLSHMLHEGMTDIVAGRTTPAEEVFKELGLGKRRKKKKVSR